MKQSIIEKSKKKSIKGLTLRNTVINYVVILMFAVRRTRFRRSELKALLFLIASPVFYMLRLKIVKTPFGVFITSTRENLRSFAYGFFKTYFCYIRSLSFLFDDLSFQTIVDVGANTGDFTLGLSRCGQKIISVEPGRENFQTLIANLRSNQITNVTPFYAAAHDKLENVHIDGNASDMFISDQGQLVSGLPLDQIAKNLGLVNIDLLKIDAQGHELKIISGMQSLLENKSIKTIIIEVHKIRGVNPLEIKSILKNYGYQLIYQDDFLFEQPHLYFSAEKEMQFQLKIKNEQTNTANINIACKKCFLSSVSSILCLVLGPKIAENT